MAEDWGVACGLGDECLVNRRGLGKAKHVDMQNLWIPEASNSIRLVTKEAGTSANPADILTQSMLRPKIEQLMIIMGYEFVEQCLKRAEAHGMRLLGSLTNAKRSPPVWRRHSKMRLEEIRSGAVDSDVEGRILAAWQEIALTVLKPLSG